MRQLPREGDPYPGGAPDVPLTLDPRLRLLVPGRGRASSPRAGAATSQRPGDDDRPVNRGRH